VLTQFINFSLMERTFSKLAKTLSDDKGSAMHDGVLPWFTCNRLVPEFVEVVYPLKNGEIAKPVLTSYGWHIIKMIDRKPVASFDEVYNDLIQRIEKDMRYNLCKQSLINKLKTEYQLSHYPKALSDFYNLVDDSIFVGKWQMPPAKKLKKQLFRFDDKKYSQADFAQYLYKNQKKQPAKDKITYVNNMYKAYVDQEILAYEDAILETKYPEFGLLMKEYHDGILLFEITQKKSLG
jgi:Parvulin-like peptidyl-prolyl isomerase